MVPADGLWPLQVIRVYGLRRWQALTVAVTVERRISLGVSEFAIKINADEFEVNVIVREDEADRIKAVAQTPWSKGALRIGTVAGAPAWWCVGDADEKPERMSILVGEDDQIWDLVLMLPINTIDLVLADIAANAGATTS